MQKLKYRNPYESGYWGVPLCIYFTRIMGRTRVDVHITTSNRFQPEGWPRKLLLQLLSLDVSRWKKYLVHFLKRALLLWYTVVYCSCKYLEIERSSFLKFQYQATQKNLLWNSSFKEMIEFNYLVNFFWWRWVQPFFGPPPGPA